MAGKNSQTRRSKSADIKTVKISQALIDEIEAIPDQKVWTAEKDELLRRYGGKKLWNQLSKVLGYSHSACRERWRKLKREEQCQTETT